MTFADALAIYQQRVRDDATLKPQIQSLLFADAPRLREYIAQLKLALQKL